MFEKEELELVKLSKKIHSTPKPDNIELYIKNGMELGIKRKHKNRIKYFANIAAILIFVIFITSIRVSPVLAAYVKRIPGLEYIVKLINYDKGVKAIVDNNFVQPVNISVEKDGITVTLKDMIIDNSKAILFYSIENNTTGEFIDFDSLEVRNEKGEKLKEIAIGWSSSPHDMNKKNKKEGSIEINFTDKTIIPEKFILALKLRENDSNGQKENVLSSTWNYEVPINKNKFKNMETTYTLNENLKIQDQKILFKTVTITPTRIAVTIEYDKNNSKKLLSFDDLTIINEKGEKWATITNGISGTGVDDNNKILYFQSNFYSKSKELYLTGTSIRALDKDKLVVAVDLMNNKLISAPDDKLKLRSVITKNSETAIEFGLETDKKLDEHLAYSLFYSTFKSADGKSSASILEASGTGQNGIQTIGFTIPSDIKSPIYLTLQDYPSRIKGSFKIRIK